jgi:hypothetical protein
LLSPACRASMADFKTESALSTTTTCWWRF